MPEESYEGPFLPLSEEELQLKQRLERHVVRLGEEIGERNVWHHAELKASEEYIEEVFTRAGYEVSFQRFDVEGKTVSNVEAVLAGTKQPDEIIVVGAHYDSVAGSPGANDNGSGVAAVLELARRLKEKKLTRTVRFVAFVNEEPPFFQTDTMGARVYAKRCGEREEKIMAMFSMETIGCYSDAVGSQRYPFPFNLFYPKTGNFIGFVGNLSSRGLVRRAISSFRRSTSFPSEGAAAPGWITGIGWSDHWAFWKEGYPAVMVTDTAPFRYPYYHTANDTPDKIDYERTARVVEGMARVLEDLAAEGMKGF
jgi:Zn-dependent M28 family amino/carboxypeptidase